MRPPDSSVNRRTKRVRVERDTGTTLNSDGEHVESWTPHCERWASVRQMSARESQHAMQTLALATHVVSLRGDVMTQDITSEMRVILLPIHNPQTSEARTLYVFGVENVDERGREIKLFCGERAPS